MKYLTKQWYIQSQLTDIHFDMKIINGANSYDESLYLKLYNQAENKYVKSQREYYDVDPRYMLEDDGSTLIALDKIVLGEALTEEDIMVYEMTNNQKEGIQELIKAYDSRSHFDVEMSRKKFQEIHEMSVIGIKDKISEVIYNQIADMRVFALGYCTKEIYDQLLTYSEENGLKTNVVLDEYYKVVQSESIPEEIKEKFGFHDCRVSNLNRIGSDMILILDIQGQYAEYDRITFQSAQIIKQEGEVVGSFWVHQELYRLDDGFELHVLLSGEIIHELTISCKNIVIDNQM